MGNAHYLYVTAREVHKSGHQINYINKDSDVLVVTLDDHDRSNAIPVKGMQLVWENNSQDATTQSFLIKGDVDNQLPVIDYNRSGSINSEDITLTDVSGSAELYAVSADNITFNGIQYASIEVICISQCNRSTTFTPMWYTSIRDTVNVSISVTDGNAGTLALTETGADTGIFEGEIHVLDALSQFSQPRVRTLSDNRYRITITAQHASRITVTYQDRISSTREKSVKVRSFVDMYAPEVQVVSPKGSISYKDTNPEFTGYFDDAGSGLLVNSAKLYVDASDDPKNTEPVIDFDNFKLYNNKATIRDTVVVLNYNNLLITNTTPSKGSITLKWRNKQTHIPQITNSPNHTVDFVASISDLAGNIGFSDANIDEFAIQPHTVHIDLLHPVIVHKESISGQGWDFKKQDFQKGDLYTLRIVFDSPLDTTSMIPNDFKVTDTRSDVSFTIQRLYFPTLITDIDYYDKNVNIKVINAKNELLKRTVFLRLNERIPAHGKLSVDIVGEVKDTAGNVANADNTEPVETQDGAPPLFTLHLHGGDSVDIPDSKGNIDKATSNYIYLLIDTDEKVVVPKVGFQVVDSDGNVISEALAKDIVRHSEGWQVTFDKSLVLLPDTNFYGKVFISVIVEDYAGNSSCLYTSDEHLFGFDKEECNYATTEQVMFIIDRESPYFDNSTLTTFYSLPSVVIEWNEKVDNIDVSLLMKGEGIVDITLELKTSDKQVFAWTLDTALPIGKHFIRASASDAVGNYSSDIEKVVEIIEHKPFTLSVPAGWSAISFPAEPRQSGVSYVFGDSSVVDIVSYEPWRDGDKWRSSSKVNGEWVGNLQQIHNGIGYFVRSLNYDTIEVLLQQPIIERNTASTIPIDVWNGWNFVGISSNSVKDISGGNSKQHLFSSSGNLLEFRDYFRYPYVAAYRMDNGIYKKITDTYTVKLGEALWVYIQDTR